LQKQKRSLCATPAFTAAAPRPPAMDLAL
jgi:hypothetical protein